VTTSKEEVFYREAMALGLERVPAYVIGSVAAFWVIERLAAL
jgi:hypothetical protein